MATSGRRQRPLDELWHPYRLAVGSQPERMVLHREHSDASAGVGYEENALKQIQ